MKDIDYWNKFYSQIKTTIEPSSFAKFCVERIISKDKSLNIVELGSGNGRDSFYLSTNNHKVFALEQSEEAIKIEQEYLDMLIKNDMKLSLINDNFIDFNFKEIVDNVDIFYSRFTMHSINEEAETTILNNVFDNLSSGGIFAIEARTTKDPLALKGMKIGVNECITDHYRRFIDTNNFIQKALHTGYQLRFFTEEDNLSIYKGDNPVLMRIILVKP